MISKEELLKVQGHVDGELSAAEAADVARWLRQNPDAAAIDKELRSLSEVLRANDSIVPVPETREFYWSKIARGIEQAEREPALRPRTTPWTWLSRWAVPMGSLAALVALLLTVSRDIPMFMTDAKRALIRREIESPIEDTSVMEFHDAKTGVTLVWIAREPEED